MICAVSCSESPIRLVEHYDFSTPTSDLGNSESSLRLNPPSVVSPMSTRPNRIGPANGNLTSVTLTDRRTIRDYHYEKHFQSGPSARIDWNYRALRRRPAQRAAAIDLCVSIRWTCHLVDAGCWLGHGCSRARSRRRCAGQLPRRAHVLCVRRHRRRAPVAQCDWAGLPALR